MNVLTQLWKASHNVYIYQNHHCLYPEYIIILCLFVNYTSIPQGVGAWGRTLPKMKKSTI